MEFVEVIGHDIYDGLHLSSYKILSQYLMKKKILAKNFNIKSVRLKLGL